jgi:hypothetical protein
MTKGVLNSDAEHQPRNKEGQNDSFDLLIIESPDGEKTA